MIRVHQIALPLDHPPEALPKAVAKRLKLPLEALGELQLFRRSVDARHKGAIELVYSIDVPVADEAAVLGKLRRDSRVMATPDPLVRPSIPAPAAYTNGRRPRPVVVGAGPCGYFAALFLAQQGYRPLVLGRGKPVKQRTADTCDAQRQTQHLGRRAKAGATESHHGEHHANPHDAEQSIATGEPGHTQGADQVSSYVGPADEASQGITNTQIVAHGRQQDTVTETTKRVPDRCRHADQQYDDPAVYPKGFGISQPLRVRHISRYLGEGALVFLTKACDAFRHIRAGPCTVVYLKGQALGQAHAIGTAQ